MPHLRVDKVTRLEPSETYKLLLNQRSQGRDPKHKTQDQVPEEGRQGRQEKRTREYARIPKHRSPKRNSYPNDTTSIYIHIYTNRT